MSTSYESIQDRFTAFAVDLVRRFYRFENMRLFLHPVDYGNLIREAVNRYSDDQLGRAETITFHTPGGVANVRTCFHHVPSGRALITWRNPSDSLVRVAFWYLEAPGFPDTSDPLFQNAKPVFALDAFGPDEIPLPTVTRIDPSTLMLGAANFAPPTMPKAGPYRDAPSFARNMRARRAGRPQLPGSVQTVGCVLPPLLGEMNPTAWRRAVARGLGVDGSISFLNEPELEELQTMIKEVTS